jgi:uncharacterized protein (TIGR03435 family)
MDAKQTIVLIKGSPIIENVSLKSCIGTAYGIAGGRDYFLSGPDWLDAERFDISAKFSPETPGRDVLLLLQRLLDERFELRNHRESREFSAYVLVLGKNVPKLHAAAAPDARYMFSARSGHTSGSSRPAFQLDCPVVDFTGLKGTFDLTLDWSLEGTEKSRWRYSSWTTQTMSRLQTIRDAESGRVMPTEVGHALACPSARRRVPPRGTTRRAV